MTAANVAIVAGIILAACAVFAAMAVPGRAIRRWLDRKDAGL